MPQGVQVRVLSSTPMNYYKARQRKDGRWDYTCQNGDLIWPVGYCDEYRDLDPKYFPGFPPEWFEHKRQEREPTKHKHHTDGHATAEEAEACYREYLLDHEIHQGNWTAQLHCAVCQSWTTGFASVGQMGYWSLCEEHNNRTEIEKLFEVGEIWSS